MSSLFGLAITQGSTRWLFSQANFHHNLRHYLRTLPCLAEPGKIIVVGRRSRSLEEVLPFLAALPSLISIHPSPQTPTLRRQPEPITLGPERVSITQVKDPQEGLGLLAALATAINATWEHRHEPVAVTSPRQAPRPLDIWALLPQSNCWACGEATCMAFAFGLAQGRRKPRECPPLHSQPVFADRCAALEAIFYPIRGKEGIQPCLC